MEKAKETTVIWPGYELPTGALQKLYRERWLKISQVEMVELTGAKQPYIAEVERCSGKLSEAQAATVADAFDSLGFSRWAASVATCEEEASMVEDMILDDSGIEWMPGDKWRRIEHLRARKGGAA